MLYFSLQAAGAGLGNRLADYAHSGPVSDASGIEAVLFLAAVGLGCGLYVWNSLNGNQDNDDQN